MKPQDLQYIEIICDSIALANTTDHAGDRSGGQLSPACGPSLCKHILATCFAAASGNKSSILPFTVSGSNDNMSKSMVLLSWLCPTTLAQRRCRTTG